VRLGNWKKNPAGWKLRFQLDREPQPEITPVALTSCEFIIAAVWNGQTLWERKKNSGNLVGGVLPAGTSLQDYVNGKNIPDLRFFERVCLPIYLSSSQTGDAPLPPD